MRIRVVHPQDDSRLVAMVGHDRALSWFAEVRHHGRLVEEYDKLVAVEPSTLAGVLQVLVKHGFFTQRDLEFGLSQLYFGFDLKEVEGDGARRVAELVVFLKQGAASD